METVAVHNAANAARHGGPSRLPDGTHNRPRNTGMELDLSWVLDTRVNLSATERRVASLPGRRTVKRTHRRLGS